MARIKVDKMADDQSSPRILTQSYQYRIKKVGPTIYVLTRERREKTGRQTVEQICPSLRAVSFHFEGTPNATRNPNTHTD
jgi:hypothetical protein